MQPPCDHLLQLAENIKTNGQILPVYWFDGEIIDGRRSFEACGIIGRVPESHYFTSIDEAAPVLWSLHPERAYKKFSFGLTQGQIANLFSCRRSDVARMRAQLTPAPEKRKRSSFVGIQFRSSREQKEHVTQRARELSVSKGELLLAALDAVSESELRAALTRLRKSRRRS